jgi:DNA-binding Lrp family transcriptional regulator
VVDGIIMVKTVRGHERRVYTMLRSLPGTKAMYILFGGDFDILMDAQVEGLLALNGLIEKVREVEGVVTIRTILTHDPERCSPLGIKAC